MNDRRVERIFDTETSALSTNHAIRISLALVLIGGCTLRLRKGMRREPLQTPLLRCLQDYPLSHGGIQRPDGVVTTRRLPQVVRGARCISRQPQVSALRLHYRSLLHSALKQSNHSEQDKLTMI
jgi:hypothetical protein